MHFRLSPFATNGPENWRLKRRLQKNFGQFDGYALVILDGKGKLTGTVPVYDLNGHCCICDEDIPRDVAIEGFSDLLIELSIISAFAQGAVSVLYAAELAHPNARRIARSYFCELIPSRRTSLPTALLEYQCLTEFDFRQFPALIAKLQFVLKNRTTQESIDNGEPIKILACMDENLQKILETVCDENFLQNLQALGNSQGPRLEPTEF